MRKLTKRERELAKGGNTPVVRDYVPPTKLAKKKTRARRNPHLGSELRTDHMAATGHVAIIGEPCPDCAFTGTWWLTDSTRTCYDEPGTGADFFDARERLRVRLAERGVALTEVVDVAFVADADVRKAAE